MGSGLSGLLSLAGLLLAAEAPALPFSFSTPTVINDEGRAGVPCYGESAGQRAITSCRDSVYAVWSDSRDPTFRVYFSKSEDRGATWGANVPVADSSAYAAIAVSTSGTIYVVWVDFTPNPLHTRISFARSSDGGHSFGPKLEVSWSLPAPSGYHWQPSIACVGTDSVYVSWHAHFSYWEEEIAVARSFDGGSWFEPAIRVTDRPVLDANPTIAAVANGRVAVAWEDSWDAGPPCGYEDPFCGYRIYIAESADGGATFGPSYPGTPLYGPAEHPSLVYTPNGALCLVWSGTAIRGATADIYFSRNPDGTGSYSSPGVVQVDGAPRGAYLQDRPSLGLNAPGQAYVAWRDTRNGDSEIWFARSLNGGQAFDSPAPVTQGIVTSDYPAVAVSPGGLAQILWAQSDGSGGSDMYASRGWPAGSSGVSPRLYESLSLPRDLQVRIMPNPAISSSGFAWFAEDVGTPQLEIYDIAGRFVASVSGTRLESGWAVATWNLQDASGSEASAGVYLVRPVPERGRGQCGRLVIGR